METRKLISLNNLYYNKINLKIKIINFQKGNLKKFIKLYEIIMSLSTATRRLVNNPLAPDSTGGTKKQKIGANTRKPSSIKSGHTKAN